MASSKQRATRSHQKLFPRNINKPAAGRHCCFISQCANHCQNLSRHCESGSLGDTALMKYFLEIVAGQNQLNRFLQPLTFERENDSGRSVSSTIKCWDKTEFYGTGSYFLTNKAIKFSLLSLFTTFLHTGRQ